MKSLYNIANTAMTKFLQKFLDPDCHVYFHSIEVARFLFARWRVWARWTRAARYVTRPFLPRGRAS